MNKVIIIGRLTKEPEVKNVGEKNIAHCNFTVAVDRRFKNSNGEREADFISCVAWRTNADLLKNYFHKGNKIGIVGTLQSRSYEKNGQTVYVTEVLVEEIHFVESRSGGNNAEENKPIAPSLPDIPEKIVINDEDLPFQF